jgi:hypothetical protein
LSEDNPVKVIDGVTLPDNYGILEYFVNFDCMKEHIFMRHMLILLRMKRHLLLKNAIIAIFLNFAILGFSQNYHIEGTVRDSETNAPINAAGILLKNSSSGTTTNELGYFRLEIFNFPSVLFIQCMGHIRDTIVISSESQFLLEYKGQRHVFLLKNNVIQLNEVEVKARSTLFEKDPYAIIDYKFIGNHIISIGYKNGNEFRKEVILGDLSGRMVGNYQFKNLDSLFQDSQSNVFVFCRDSAFEIQLKRKTISISNSYPRSYIQEYIVPVCGLSDSLIFLKKSSPHH